MAIFIWFSSSTRRRFACRVEQKAVEGYMSGVGGERRTGEGQVDNGFDRMLRRPSATTTP